MKAVDTKKASAVVNDFLAKLGVQAKAKVFTVEEYLKIEIEGKDSSLLIGFHGDNLRALKHILAIILRRQIDEDVIVTVDIAGYLAQKEERIKGMAQKAIDKFEKTKKPQDLPEMNSYERRIAHSYISDAGYTSDSVGDDKDRHIVVGN